ncbi:hypothetical protein M758_UG087600 [Ceratodon purpureus]|nr:hypothetical protein M758_UG087600 [Ceratodon purpureus]
MSEESSVRAPSSERRGVMARGEIRLQAEDLSVVELLRLILWLLWVIVRRFGDYCCGESVIRDEVTGVRRGVKIEGGRVSEGFRGKWYAVKRGFVPGIYRTWGECETQVRGFRGA